MITPVNSSNTFKAIYKPDKNLFTKSQQRVATDMESKLAYRAISKDFCIEPYGQNHVALFSVEGVDKSSFSGQYLYDKKVLCAICDEFTPLKVENVDLAEELHLNAKAALAVVGNILLALLASAAIVGGIFCFSGGKNSSKIQQEVVQKVDTLKNNLVKNL